jgi:hypothetical protein
MTAVNDFVAGMESPQEPEVPILAMPQVMDIAAYVQQAANPMTSVSPIDIDHKRVLVNDGGKPKYEIQPVVNPYPDRIGDDDWFPFLHSQSDKIKQKG